jgi:hypothetical protein
VVDDLVTLRLALSTPAELAAVTLYERASRGRATVLSAVQRRLRTGAPAS